MQWVAFCKGNPECIDFVAVSSGTGEKDWARLTQIVRILNTACLLHRVPLELRVFGGFV